MGMLLALLLLQVHQAAGAELIPLGSTWKYYDGASAPGATWNELGFTDSSWAQGPAQLGYGDGSINTTISYGTDANNKRITAYFRHSFTVADASQINQLDLELMRDDGGVVYLNGVEIYRSNMPSGTISDSTLALDATGTESTLHLSTLTPGATLVNGTNVVAVEIHQQSVTSSDLRMDLRLSPSANLIPYGATWKYLDDGIYPPEISGNDWKEIDFVESISWAGGAAELGYGDSDSNVTTVGYGGNLSAKYITTYFRHSFDITNPIAIEALVLDLVRDDGAIVYLNNNEVFRSNMPTGAVNDSTTASSATTNESIPRSQAVSPSLLVAGANVIAVEVHQFSPTSSDMRMNLRLRVVEPEAAAVDRGPYLQLGAHDRMIVRWRTNIPTSSILKYGTSVGTLDQTLANSTLVTDHSVEITGLATDSKYYYSIGSDTQTFAAGAEYFFETHPPVGSAGPTRIWVLGDSGTANSDARNVRDAFESVNGSAHTDLLLMLGDNAYNTGTESEYQAAVFDTYPDTIRNTVLWSTVGNHDASNKSSPYFSMFDFPTAGEAGGVASGTECYYSFDYANIHFVCLDSHLTVGNSSNETMMLNWLQNDLAATSQEFIIAFWHHPPYSKGSHDSDIDPTETFMREVFNPIVEDYGVDLVLGGHSHSYERSMLINGHYGLSTTFNSATMARNTGDGDPGGNGAYQKVANPNQGAVYAVAGSSGKISGGALNHPVMVTNLNKLGSMILDVTATTIEARFIDDTGAQLDAFTIEHITPANDAPVLVDNLLSLIKETPVTLHPSNLSATDTNDVLGTLIFTVSGVSGGSFQINSNVVTSFTQQQVIDGDVVFVPTGTGAPSYSVIVSDGMEDSGFPQSAVINFHQTDGDARSPAFELLFGSSDTQFDSDCPIVFGTNTVGTQTFVTYTLSHTSDLSSLPSGLVVSFSAAHDSGFTPVTASSSTANGDGTQTDVFQDPTPVDDNGTPTPRYGKITVGGEASEIFATVPTIVSGAPTSDPMTSAITRFSPGIVGRKIASGTATSVGTSTLTDTNTILGTLTGGPFYVLLTSGDNAGTQSTITSNTATQLSLADDLSGLDVVGESYEICKHLTIAALFGAANEAGLSAGANSSVADNLLLASSAVQTFFYSDAPSQEGWKDSLAGDASDVSIHPITPVAIRRRVTGDLTVYPTGPTRRSPIVVTLAADADTMIGLPNSTAVTLSALGLDDVVERGPNPVVADNLLIVNSDNSVTRCFYSNIVGFSGWLDISYEPAAMIPSGSVIIFRRNGIGAPQWTIPATTP